MADESHDERVQRETMELLNELRVVLPGIQVLLAVLLTAPFNQRFSGLSSGNKAAYITALGCTAVATTLLMAPTTYHRVQFRQRDKERLLRLSNGLLIAGTAFLAAGLTSAIGLVTDLAYGEPWTIVATVATAVVMVSTWYLLPLSRGRQRGDAREERS
jgi:hypothetical protein